MPVSPLTSTWKAHLSEYYAPKNFNFWYAFGSLALLVLVIQIVTGIFLVMHYKPDATLAFASVEYIMRDVPWGWLVRYMHSTGASAFFIVVYLHMVRGLLYGSYRKPRELVWLFGVAIFLCLMGEAFMGYLLPWGQMSYWGAQVIVNLFGAIPFIGPDLSLWIRGDYVVSDATLNRFFSFHVIAIPLVLIGLVVAHIIALHEVGSNNPDGVEIKEKLDANGVPLDGVPFHPYYSVHDVMAVAVFLIVFTAVVFFAPEMGGYFLEYNNFVPADSLKTPPHIAPVWYFTPFYSILRCHHFRLHGLADGRRGSVCGADPDQVPAQRQVQAGGNRRRRGSDRRHVAVRCEVLGCGADGRVGHDSWWPAMAGSVASQVDPLSSELAQVCLHRVRDCIRRTRLPWCATTDRDRYCHCAGRHVHLLRLLPVDALVERHGQVQACTGPRYLSAALSRKEEKHEIAEKTDRRLSCCCRRWLMPVKAGSRWIMRRIAPKMFLHCKWRQAVCQLLSELSLRFRHALQPPARHRPDRRPDQEQPAVHRTKKSVT